jgi:ribosome-binding protein aMBF1 (putative translation factor)
MADVKKFLDKAGVSTLWSRVATKIGEVDAKAVANAGAIATLEGKVDALEKGTYNDSEVRGLIGANAEAIATNAGGIATNAAAIAILNSDAATTGSVAHTAEAAAAAKVAEVVAGADANFDTLKEIADWITNDTTGAADMANDIAALQGLVGNKKVADAIADAIAAEGLDKYALASELTALAERVSAIEKAGYQNAEQVGSAIDAKIAALNLATTYEAKGAAATAEANAKAHADSLNATMNGRVAALEAIEHNFDVVGSAATAEANAKAYADTEINNKIIALTADEIDAAIAAATKA